MTEIIVCAVIAILSLAFAARCYIELHKWAYQCKRARIVIAYKNKVRLNAPIVDYIKWVNLLDKDKDTNGRPVYMMGGTTVAILKGKPTVKQRSISGKVHPQSIGRIQATDDKNGRTQELDIQR